MKYQKRKIHIYILRGREKMGKKPTQNGGRNGALESFRSGSYNYCGGSAARPEPEVAVSKRLRFLRPVHCNLVVNWIYELAEFMATERGPSTTRAVAGLYFCFYLKWHNSRETAKHRVRERQIQNPWPAKKSIRAINWQRGSLGVKPQ